MICLACLSPLKCDTHYRNDRATHYECSSNSCELKTSILINPHQNIIWYYFFLDYNPSTSLCSIITGSQNSNETICSNNNTKVYLKSEFIPFSPLSYYHQVPTIFNKLLKLKAFT